MINNTVEVDPLRCGHCKTINLLEIISKNNDYIIQSHCGSCNSKTKEIPMYSFIHSSSQLSSDSYKCSLHPDKGYKYYCKSCRMNYCELSLSKHSKHDIVKLDDLMNEEKYKKYYELLRQANIIVKKISNEIKTSLVNSLTEQALLLNNYIKNIEESYSNYRRVNNRLLGILQVLYEMYNKSKEHTCYQFIMNMPEKAAKTLAGFNLITTTTNAALAVVIASALYLAVASRFKKNGTLNRLLD